MNEPEARIKVCGITNLRDAQAACALGAWAIGFIFYPPSPRSVEPAQAARIADSLPHNVRKVGVFVDSSLREILEVAERVGLDIVQLHGAEGRELVDALLPHFEDVWKAVRIGSRLPDLEPFRGITLLLDTYRKDRPGGTGETFPWERALEAKCCGRVVLAGGLRPENVAAAVLAVRPYAVDVASGVESAPGEKDHLKLERFFEEAHRAWKEIRGENGTQSE